MRCILERLILALLEKVNDIEFLHKLLEYFCAPENWLLDVSY